MKVPEGSGGRSEAWCGCGTPSSDPAEHEALATSNQQVWRWRLGQSGLLYSCNGKQGEPPAVFGVAWNRWGSAGAPLESALVAAAERATPPS